MDAAAETTLRELGERGDIIKRIHRGLTERGIERATASYVLAGESLDVPIVGRLVDRGLDVTRAIGELQRVGVVADRARFQLAQVLRHDAFGQREGPVMRHPGRRVGVGLGTPGPVHRRGVRGDDRHPHTAQKPGTFRSGPGVANSSFWAWAFPRSA